MDSQNRSLTSSQGWRKENKLDEIHCFSLGDIVLRNQNPILLLSFDSPFDKCSI